MTDSLRKHLGVKKARDGDTLQIPITGTLDEPKVRLDSALAGLANVRAKAEAVDKIIANLAEVRPTLFISVPRVFNRIYDGLHAKMNEEGGLKKKLFDAAVETAEKRKTLAAEGKRSGWLDFKFNILDGLVFSKVRERFGGRLKYAFSGGAAISKEVAEFIDNLGITVYEGYGLSETSPIATMNYPGARKIGSVGKPIPGVEIEIDIAATEDPKQGEIVIYGHNIMEGYHNLPEASAEAFTEDGFFRTGDIAEPMDLKTVFALQCAPCHGAEGEGHYAFSAPALAGQPGRPTTPVSRACRTRLVLVS